VIKIQSELATSCPHQSITFATRYDNAWAKVGAQALVQMRKQQRAFKIAPRPQLNQGRSSTHL